MPSDWHEALERQPDLRVIGFRGLGTYFGSSHIVAEFYSVGRRNMGARVLVCADVVVHRIMVPSVLVAP